MKKPERVEVGQWWIEDDDGLPVRIIALEDASPYNNAGPWAIYTDGAVPQGSLLYSGTYLGSGDHPEPSEWMIETLARHAFEVVCAAKDPSLDVPWDDKDEHSRRYYADSVRDALAGNERSKYLVLEFKRATLSLYRILRSLGKW